MHLQHLAPVAETECPGKEKKNLKDKFGENKGLFLLKISSQRWRNSNQTMHNANMIPQRKVVRELPSDLQLRAGSAC